MFTPFQTNYIIGCANVKDKCKKLYGPDPSFIN